MTRVFDHCSVHTPHSLCARRCDRAAAVVQQQQPAAVAARVESAAVPVARRCRATATPSGPPNADAATFCN